MNMNADAQDLAAMADSMRQTMPVDIVCVGFGPAMGGFLTTLNRGLTTEDGLPKVDESGMPAIQSPAMPGLPLQVICYERADDPGFGVSGVVTKARGIRASLPELDITQIPMATEVKHEEVLYLLDPHGASRRSATLKAADAAIRAFRFMLPFRDDALRLPYIPSFLRKDGGLLLSIGQFNQWVSGHLMASGAVQIWPSTPVAKALVEDGKVRGVRLVDQGTDKTGRPDAGFMPGMDIEAALTVIGDGPVGPVGRQLDEELGMPEGHHKRDWAVGMKMVIDLPEGCELKEGTVLHTFGYPEPEIFGFLYVYPGNVASAGIFVPSWFDSPVRTSYRLLQYWMRHPSLWKHLRGGRLRSWGAKTLQESGKRGEPHLAGDGYARIGEGSGSTNVLTGSGVDEAWTTGTQLGEAVLELLKDGKPFTKENLQSTYVKKRRESWVEAEGRVAEKSRDGFGRGMVTGLIGMALAGLSKGKLHLGGEPKRPYERMTTVEEYYRGVIPPETIARVRQECATKGLSLHDELMRRAGWPEIEYDGQLLLSHQDALLLGGKVQAPGGYADHVVFLYPNLCEQCGTKICVEVCSGQAITANPEGGQPLFDREKCVHCGACLWNCAQPLPEDPERMNIAFNAGAGGLHSAEN